MPVQNGQSRQVSTSVSGSGPSRLRRQSFLVHFMQAFQHAVAVGTLDGEQAEGGEAQVCEAEGAQPIPAQNQGQINGRTWNSRAL